MTTEAKKTSARTGKSLNVRMPEDKHQRFVDLHEALRKKIDVKLTQEEVLMMLIDAYESNTIQYTNVERELINRAAQIAGETPDSIIKKGALLFAQKTLTAHKKGDEPIDLTTSKTAGAADMRVEEAVNAMMEENDKAANWYDRKFINQRALIERTGANRAVIQRYLVTHQEQLDAHHAKHKMTEDHNRQVFNYQRVHGKTE